MTILQEHGVDSIEVFLVCAETDLRRVAYMGVTIIQARHSMVQKLQNSGAEGIGGVICNA